METVAGYRHNLIFTKFKTPITESVRQESPQQFIIFHLVSVMLESDGLIFDPAQITSRAQNGVAVPHGNHITLFLYTNVWKKSLPSTIPYKSA